MRLRTIGLLMAFWTGVVFIACGTSPSSSTSSSGGTTGTGGAPSCDGLWFVYGEDGGHPCDICMRDKCCAELAACGTDHCLTCATFSGDACCDGGCVDVDALWRAARHCAVVECQPTCFPTCFPGFCHEDGGDGG